MLRIRIFDEQALRLFNEGKIPGGIHLTIGQEAEVAGSGLALNPDDYTLGNHRSHGHPIGRGADLNPLMAELFGKATGVCRGHGGSMHLADFSVGSLGESGIVGAGMPIAVGAGLSAQLRGSDQVALTYFGDGAANNGLFHESLNLASVWKLPVIFLCENNGYGVTTPAAEVTAVEDIGVRGVAYDVPYEIVDGQDVQAVFEATTRAVERARAGEGPTLLDVKTYRYRHHAEFGGVEFSLAPYRTDEEVQAWLARDPIKLFTEKVIKTGALSAARVDTITEEVTAEVAEAVRFAEQSPLPDVSSAYEDLYANPIPV
ncbi:thiamine pyrophosphate-dependent dehydrogenase E1 component subunit alpha [Microbacterium sp. No. 7]|uniref:thiamine pyrophosphate-dependent dehydrogenase E1 component subunit alpha n=1 Tax=Microbacterium sp. No. 7 TaxID=1714373 RepID=UPI0012E2C108|nr:thiamine pyrophosphate-dependent dehydrogenase E1 component subunit alpha [Microbacterium sp. No. 7]